MIDAEQDEQFYRDTESIAFPKLSDPQIAQLDPLGKRRTLRRGEILFKAGQRDLGMQGSGPVDARPCPCGRSRRVDRRDDGPKRRRSLKP